MSCKVAGSVQEKVTLRRKNSDQRENMARGSVTGIKLNHCVMLPASHSIVAEALERKNNNWTVRTKMASDLILQLGDSTFHLHKIPMVSKSGYISRLVFDRTSTEERGLRDVIRIDNFPGGAETFELVVKFCYGWKIDASAANVSPLHCAAHFLEMSDDLEPGNLFSKTEAFLSFLIFSSWKDMFCVLKSCELVSPWAKELKIVRRCTEAIAWKACIDPKGFCSGFDDREDREAEEVAKNWWFKDVSSLRIDHFMEVIENLKRNGMRSELVGSCITQWTAKWLSRVTTGYNNIPSKNLTQKLQKVTTESLIKLLPVQENSVSCNFMLHLLKLGLVMKIESELSDTLMRRVASMLEQSSVSDLMVKNYKENEAVYDAGIITQVVKSYFSCECRNRESRILAVGRLVDGYLTRIARDMNLKAQDFQSLAEALPESARSCQDNLYRAVDTYLKAHPGLTKEERLSVCRAMDYHKFSREARDHVVKNDRLPLEMTARFVLLEQVNMAKSMTIAGSNYQRTKTQAVIRVSKGLERGRWINQSENEIKMMKKEVEKMKVQLSNLQMCKMAIQRQAKRCVT